MRRLRGVGRPTTAGTYSFKVSVRASYPGGQEDGFYSLCWTEEEKTYVIAVEAKPS